MARKGGRGRGRGVKRLRDHPNQTEGVAVKADEGVLSEIKEEDSLGNTQKEEAEGVDVSLTNNNNSNKKKKKMKPGRKSKKDSVENDGDGHEKVVAARTLRKRPEVSERVVVGDGEKGKENGVSGKKRGWKKVTPAEEKRKKGGVLEVSHDKKHAKDKEEDGRKVVHSFRRLREQGHLSPAERKHVRIVMILWLSFAVTFVWFLILDLTVDRAGVHDVPPMSEE